VFPERDKTGRFLHFVQVSDRQRRPVSCIINAYRVVIAEIVGDLLIRCVELVGQFSYRLFAVDRVPK
jgi:hypothetical protein